MDYTQVIGNTNELKCMIAFMELGYDCSIPYGNCSKYDFIVDLGDKFIKIQCKSSHYVRKHGSQKEDAFTFSTVCSTLNTKEKITYKYNNNQIDYFATSFNKQVYVIPFKECEGLTSKTLRLAPPANGNSNCSYAEEYLIEKQFPEYQPYIESKEKYLSRNIKPSIGISNPDLFKCSECGAETTVKNGLCINCAREKSRKAERPDRETLKSLIRTTPFTTIGKNYNVTDNTIRKWCKAYNLPHKSSEIKNISDVDWELI